MEHRERIGKSMERKVEEGFKKVFKVIFFIILGVAIAFLVGYIVMRLWNWLMPELFGLPVVGYWQAVGILILAKIIFGFGGGDGPGNSSSSKKKKSRRCRPMRKDFSEWRYYDQFWSEEGEKAYKEYVEKIQTKTQD